MKLNFVKLTNKWFADVVNWPGDVMQLEMVAGADEFLEELSEGHRYISLDVSDNPITNGYKFKLIDIDDEGSTYYCKELEKTIWLCIVTVTVFGEFPQNIWFKVLNKF